jgi:long-chain fatty acid transport protein
MARNSSRGGAGAALLCAWACGSATAGGFQLRENDVRALGRAYAGVASAPDNPVVAINNPGALGFLEGRQVALDLHGVDPDARFDGGGVDAAGRPVLGGDGGDPASLAAVPATTYHQPLGERWHLGLSLGAPYGLETHYDKGWVGRYQALRSKLTTVELGAALAYEVSEELSLGGGVGARYADGILSNAIDLGAILAAQQVPGFAPQSADGKAEVSGDDWVPTLTLGLLWRMSEQTRIGLAWRSAADLELDSEADFDVPDDVAAILAASGSALFRDTGAVASIANPATATASLYHQTASGIGIAADIAWTGWSRFERIDVEFDNAAQPDVREIANWRDTWYAALGVDWPLNAQWTVRAGVAHDQTPTRDEYRTPRVADADRNWLSLGATWAPGGDWVFDLGYAHLFFADDPTVSNRAATGSTLAGSFDSSADVVGVAARWRF